MAQEDSIMTNAPLTPSEDAEPEPTSPIIDYSPASIAYNEAFENELMDTILNPPENQPAQAPRTDPPIIPPPTLPVPLTSLLRTHPSPIPGVLLTHPNGYHTGGPSPSPAIIAEFAKKFIEENGIEDAGQLERIVEEKIKEKMEEVKERMREREEMVTRNKGVERELGELEVQRSAELRVAEKMRGGKGKGK